jgi:hypothetical protein
MPRQTPNRWSQWAAAGWLFCLAGLWPCPVQAADLRPTRYEARAAFLLNFARYVEWPKETFAHDASPVVLGVLGGDEDLKDIRIIDKQRVKDKRNLEVRRLKSFQEARTCHMLFIGPSEAGNLDHTLRVLQSLPVFTVGEFGGFLERGGILNLVPIPGPAKEQSLLRWEINLPAAMNARLRLDPELLRLARRVVKP